MVAWLLLLFNSCFETARVLGDWCRACFVQLYKEEGDIWECSNSRGVSLLNAMGKLYARVLIGRIRTGGEEQYGFRSGRGCIDQIFT